MAGKFSSMFARIRDDQSHEFKPSLALFSELDIDQIRKNLKPADKGKKLGEQGIPPLGSESLDSVETEIEDWVESKKKEDLDALQDQLDISSERLGALNFEQRASDISQAIKSAMSEFERIIEEGKDEIHERRRDLQRREEDLKNFRDDNRLRRGAHYPSKPVWWLLIAILIGMFGGETYANSAFLARGNELGLLGALIEALAISAANLFPAALLIGPFLRNLNHVSVGWKASAFLLLLAWAAFAILFNLGVAHYREVSGFLFSEAGQEVIQRIRTDPLGLQEAQSWVLFIIGFFLATLAIIEGYKLDDPYPKYGAYDRKTNAVRAHYIEVRQGIIDDLHDKLVEAVEALDFAKRDLSRYRQEHAGILEGRKRLFTSFEHQLEHLERACNTLLSEYREANRAARSDGKAPKRFSKKWEIDRPTLDIGPPETAMGKEAMMALGDKTEAELKEGIERLHARFKEAMQDFERLDHLAGDTAVERKAPAKSDPEKAPATEPEQEEAVEEKAEHGEKTA